MYDIASSRRWLKHTNNHSISVRKPGHQLVGLQQAGACSAMLNHATEPMRMKRWDKRLPVLPSSAALTCGEVGGTHL